MGQVLLDELRPVGADPLERLQVRNGGRAQLRQRVEVRGHDLDGAPRQVRHQGQGAHAARRDLAIQVRDLVHVQAQDVRNRGQVHDPLRAERGQLGLDAGQVVRVRDVVAHDEGALGRGAAHEVLDLQGQQAAL